MREGGQGDGGRKKHGKRGRKEEGKKMGKGERRKINEKGMAGWGERRKEQRRGEGLEQQIHRELPVQLSQNGGGIYSLLPTRLPNCSGQSEQASGP